MAKKKRRKCIFKTIKIRGHSRRQKMCPGKGGRMVFAKGK